MAYHSYTYFLVSSNNRPCCYVATEDAARQYILQHHYEIVMERRLKNNVLELHGVIEVIKKHRAYWTSIYTVQPITTMTTLAQPAR